MKIVKSSGEKVPFSLEKLRRSLKASGADEALVSQIVNRVREELYQGISTREIYNRAYALLKLERTFLASRYKLKKAIYELGPTGYPFEKYVSAIMKASGYNTIVGKILPGICVRHEIDVFAVKEEMATIVECKFHGEEGRNCNVKVPLYIHSRYMDVKGHWEIKGEGGIGFDIGWVVTNTRFTEDALAFGKCAGLFLLSWDHPKGDGLKDRIDRFQLYPVTVSTLLSQKEIQFLLDRDVVLCKQLIKESFYLDHLGISAIRKAKILKEMGTLCNTLKS
tara:strand:+ start:187625 stop:188461 length:837 start_codon:yes stop_codon:yes gene_type:complete